MLKLVSIVFLFLTSSAFALNFPVNQKVDQKRLLQLGKFFTTGYDFEGIVALNNCSGSIIQFEGASDQSPAIILTNGHCVETGMAAPGTYKYKQPSTRAFTVLNPNATNAGRINATELIYSTMTGTDIALYKTRETYADIKTKYNVRPYVLSAKHPELGTAMQVISGYWRRGYSCNVEAFIPELREDGWVMNDSIRYSRPGCETIGGTSGSPVIATGTREVIGINNTGNEDGGRCTMNNPCEVDATGKISAVKGYSYGQQTYQIYSCVTATNEIDIRASGCQLFH